MGVVLAAKKPDFSGFFLADDSGHVAGAEAAVEGAYFGAGLAKNCVVGRDCEVADHVEDVASSDCVTCHHGDDCFGAGAD